MPPKFRSLVTLAAAAAVLPGGVAMAHAPAQRGAPELDRHVVRTVLIPPNLTLRTATYTPSGKILVTYARTRDEDPLQVNLATMDDDGRNWRPFLSVKLPARPKDNGLRYMVFADNRRIFLGDFVVECATSLETCRDPRLVPVDYPAEVADGDHISHRWSEMIVAPDNKTVAWTTLFADYSAMVFTGELRRASNRYRITAPRIVSTLDPFSKDSKHPDGVLVGPMRGGEVKQFVHGGTGISLAGALRRDTPDSVVQHLATGRIEAITDDAAYTETTIFSPDERLGITMTTRFSPKSNMAILGLLPRPYPAALNMSLPMLAYTYAVTGVRRSRPGNVGPALIDIRASKTQPGYMGTNLSTSPEWVYYSPMSWHPSSRKAMWMEARRGDEASMRMQVVELPGYRGGPAVPARPVPKAIPYALTDMGLVKSYAGKGQVADVKVYGKASGHLTYRRTADGRVEKTYVNFSDDGRQVYSGRETMQANPRSRSTYVADVTLTGPKPGRMALQITFGPLGGPSPAALIFDKGPDGQPLTRGFAEYGGQRLEASSLVP